MKKIVPIFTLFVMLSIVASAQTAKNVIQGFVYDAKEKSPIEFASVALIPEGSTTPVNGCNSEENGSFIITGVNPGKYTLQFSFIGYLTDTRKLNITSASGKLNVGKISLKKDSKLLKEVVISEQRSQMSFEIDKRVFTVDQSIASTDTTVLSLIIFLKRAVFIASFTTPISFALC